MIAVARVNLAPLFGCWVWDRTDLPLMEAEVGELSSGHSNKKTAYTKEMALNRTAAPEVENTFSATPSFNVFV